MAGSPRPGDARGRYNRSENTLNLETAVAHPDTPEKSDEAGPSHAPAYLAFGCVQPPFPD
jgi:hypothetical protein